MKYKNTITLGLAGIVSDIIILVNENYHSVKGDSDHITNFFLVYGLLFGFFIYIGLLINNYKFSNVKIAQWLFCSFLSVPAALFSVGVIFMMAFSGNDGGTFPLRLIIPGFIWAALVLAGFKNLFDVSTFQFRLIAIAIGVIGFVSFIGPGYLHVFLFNPFFNPSIFTITVCFAFMGIALGFLVDKKEKEIK